MKTINSICAKIKCQFDRMKYQSDCIKRQGIFFYGRGLYTKVLYMKLQKIYGFSDWHLTPWLLRPYATDIVKYVNNIDKIYALSACEVGCGLGDIIRHIEAKEKCGYDIGEKNIACARYLANKWGGRTNYYVGGFEELLVDRGSVIDIFITVNFIHGIAPSVLKGYYDKIIELYHPEFIIVDVQHNMKGAYEHNFEEIIPLYRKRECISEYKDTEVFVLRME